MRNPHVRITVPEPCSEKWEKMPATERGAFCSVCTKNLYDFTKMTTPEITEVIRTSKEKVCGRFRNDQLEQPHTFPAVEINAFRNAPQIHQFLYVLWLAFGLTLFSCTPDKKEEIPIHIVGAMEMPPMPNVDTLINTDKKVGGSCVAPEGIINVTGEVVGALEPPDIIYRTTPGIPELTVEPPIETFGMYETEPVYPGGESDMMYYLRDAVKYPEEAKANNIQGTVFVEFTVNSEGKVINPRILKGIGHGCDEAALTAVNNMPDWKPAYMNSKKVSSVMRVPVRFVLK